MPWAALVLALAVLVSTGRASLKIIWKTLGVTLPLAGWLVFVWVIVAERAPDSMLLYQSSPGDSPWRSVTAIGLRFLALALVTFGVINHASRIEPAFTFKLFLPSQVKAVILAAASLVGSFREGLARAHTALVTAGLLTTRRSLLNLKNGWLLLRTTWVAWVGISSERLDTKWEIEDLPFSAPLNAFTGALLTLADILWLLLAIILTVLQAMGLSINSILQLAAFHQQ